MVLLSVRLKAFLPARFVSARPFARQSRWIISGQVVCGVALATISFSIKFLDFPHHLPHGHAIWVDRCRVSFPGRRQVIFFLLQKHIKPHPEIRILVLPMLTRNAFSVIVNFPSIGFSCSSSSYSEMYEDQVIGMHVCLVASCTKLLWEGFWNCDIQ